LLVARSPRWVRNVLAFMALGALLTVALIALSVAARSDTGGQPPSETTKPPACYPVIVHIERNTLGCPDVASLNVLTRKWKTKESVERADKKTFNRVMDELGRKGCFWFKKGGAPLEAVEADDEEMVQIVVFWEGRHQLMWVIAEALRVDPKQKARCAQDWNAHGSIVVLEHDWSAGCADQAGIEGWFADARKYHFDNADTFDADKVMSVLEARDCVLFKKKDVPAFELIEVSKYCKVMPIFPATADNKTEDPLWFSCKAFNLKRAEPPLPLGARIRP
jgi:hypothetical protein